MIKYIIKPTYSYKSPTSIFAIPKRKTNAIAASVVPYIAGHIRHLAQSLDSKIPGAENLLVRQLSRYLFYPRDE